MDNLFFGFKSDKTPKQTPEEIITKLVDQVQTCTLLEDRRGAVLGLKGLARDWKLVSYNLYKKQL
jgi:hypothetical protein